MPPRPQLPDDTPPPRAGSRNSASERLPDSPDLLLLLLLLLALLLLLLLALLLLRPELLLPPAATATDPTSAAPTDAAAPAVPAAPPAGPSASTSSSQTRTPAAFNDSIPEAVFYEGSAGNAELLVSLLLAATLVFIPLTIQVVGKRLWIKYVFTNKRIKVRPLVWGWWCGARVLSAAAQTPQLDQHAATDAHR